MASYRYKEKAVQELIDKYTQDNLDNYVRATIKEAGVAKMNEGASAIEVADAVFDCIDKILQVIAIWCACQTDLSKSILLVLRNEIIAALK